MKKILCLVLSVVMALSCFTGVAFAADNTEVALPNDINELVNNGTLDGFNYFGLTIDFLYKNTFNLNWPSLSISWNDASIMMGNLNSYLVRTFEKHFTRTTLYCGEYATKICNFIGHLFYPNFVDKTIVFPNDFATEERFYEVICEQSGLTALLQKKLCPHWAEVSYGDKFNYAPLLSDLGADIDDLPDPDKDISNGKRVAELVVKSAVKKAISLGPINYIVSLVGNFSKKYSLFHSEPIKALFSYKINAGYITAEELNTFKGLFNLIFNDNNPNDTSKLQFITPPVKRWSIAKDDTEVFLYLMAYLRMVGRYANNAVVVNSIENKISALTTFDSTEKSRMNKMIRLAFFEDYDGMESFMEELTQEGIDNIKPGLERDFKMLLDRILESITKFFDKIFSIFKRI